MISLDQFAPTVPNYPTLNMTVSSGATLLVLCAAYYGGASPPATNAEWIVGSDVYPLTRAGAQGGTSGVEIWYLVNPPAGTGHLYWAGSPTPGSYYFCGYSFFGTLGSSNAIAGVTGSVAAAGTTAISDALGGAAGDWLIDVALLGGSNAMAGAGQTSAGRLLSASYEGNVASGSVPMSWSYSTSTGVSYHAVVRITATLTGAGSGSVAAEGAGTATEIFSGSGASSAKVMAQGTAQVLSTVSQGAVACGGIGTALLIFSGLGAGTVKSIGAGAGNEIFGGAGQGAVRLAGAGYACQLPTVRVYPRAAMLRGVLGG